MPEELILSQQVLDVREIRLRLIEAAAQLPAVRIKTDDKSAAAQAHAIAETWYNNFVNGEKVTKSQPGKATSKK